jgi:hypothetical protein
MQANDLITEYRVDAEFRICSVNEAWHRFYKENGDGRSPQAFVGDLLFEHISSAEMRDLYRKIFARVARSGAPMTFPFRCDSQDVKREMEMTVSTSSQGGFDFQNRIIHIERFPPGTQTASALPEMLCVCGWCDRVKVEGQWIELPLAMSVLNPFSRTQTPQISHGICSECNQRIRKMLRTKR